LKVFSLGSFHAKLDDRIISMATKFLIKIQSKDGSFVEIGNVIHREMQVKFKVLLFFLNSKPQTAQ